MALPRVRSRSRLAPPLRHPAEPAPGQVQLSVMHSTDHERPANRIVKKLWSYCHVLRDDGLSYQDYLEQLTFLLFLKMADERAALTGEPQAIPAGYRWADLANPKMEGVKLEQHYRDTLRKLGEQGGMLGLIFSKAQNKIQDPAKLRQLVVDLIGKEYVAGDVGGRQGRRLRGPAGAERPGHEERRGAVLHAAAAHRRARGLRAPAARRDHRRPGLRHGRLSPLRPRPTSPRHYKLDQDQKRHLRYDALRGVELVDGVARLCAMNLFLHGIGPDDGKKKPPIKTDDALRNEPSEHVDVVLTNPPFGKKSSITVINDEGETDKESHHLQPAGLLDDDLEQAAQLRPAREVDAEDPRPRRRRRARQRALRGRRRREGPAQAAAGVRGPHAPAAAHRHLLRAGREGERALLRPEARREGAVDEEGVGLRPAAPTRSSR